MLCSMLVFMSCAGRVPWILKFAWTAALAILEIFAGPVLKVPASGTGPFLEEGSPRGVRRFFLPIRAALLKTWDGPA